MCRLNDDSETVNILLLCGWRVVAERMRRTLTDNMCKYKVVCMCLLGGSPYGVGEDTICKERRVLAQSWEGRLVSLVEFSY